jgi:uncharacterized surface protein with fasciclin (FAS1) repeats
VGVFFVSCDNEELKNLLEIAQSTDGLESLVNVIAYAEEYAAEYPGITEGLADVSLTITIFAPNNEGFVAVFGDIDGDGFVEAEDIRDELGLDDAANAEDLLGILGLHVIEDQELFASDVIAADGGSIGPTASDPAVDLLVTVQDSTVTLTPDVFSSTGADIVTTDVDASNGVAHILGGVLLPPLPK